MIDDRGRSGAPGDLEDVRVLLNSWQIPNDTRVARDDLPAWLQREGVWAEHFSAIPFPGSGGDSGEVVEVRQALRALVDGDAAAFDAVLARRRPVMSVGEGGAGLRFERDGTAVGAIVAVVLAAAADGTLARLRTCDDCQWAFYDTSRNGRRRWCAMYPAPGGRGCGSAAKAREYRRRAHINQTDDARWL